MSTMNPRLKLPKKLQDRYMGQFEVLKHMEPNYYKLNISHSAAKKKIHPVFYVSLLSNFEDNWIRWQLAPIEVDGE